jgi:two-component system, LuxR family, sensor kinase FixL
MLQSMLKHLMDPSAIYSRDNRKRFLVAAALSVVAIALLDAVTPNFPVGFLYFFPILLIAGFVSRPAVAIVALICGLLTGEYSDYPLKEALSVSLMAFTGFTGTGFLVSEILRSRRLVAEHERELRGLIESSPLAIITIDLGGRIRLANRAAQNLFAPGDTPVHGQPIGEFLPALETIVQQHRSNVFSTQLRCRGKRRNGETFLAEVWFSTSGSALNPLLAAIVVDLSQDLRDREDLSLEYLLTNARILLGAIAHEIRNVCGAVLVTYGNLSRLPELRANEDFRTLGSLVEGLKILSAMELRSSDKGPSSVKLAAVLDEFRIVIEPTYRESGMEIVWKAEEDLPLVAGDHYGLLQVFLNLAKNSRAAMEHTERKRLNVGVSVEPNSVVVRFEDTGVGIANPQDLFRPFQPGAGSTGLGLYISRAILNSFGAEIICEPRPVGCCFAVVLQLVSLPEALNA